MLNKTLVIIPAYNEEKRVISVVNECRKYTKDEIDIIIVNDGSEDGTLKLCEENGLDVISIPFNMGVGNALKTGFKYAIENRYKYVITLDADGQHNPSDIPKFLDELKSDEYDIIIGSRFLNGNTYEGSRIRILGIKLFAKLISLIIREKLTDVTSGYRGMNHRVLNFTIIDVFNFDYPDADFLLTLHRAGFRFKEIPVDMNKRLGGRSQHRGLKPVFYVFKMMQSIFIILLRGKSKKINR